MGQGNDRRMTYQSFEIHEESRASRWLITADHASNTVPPCAAGGDLGLPASEMGRHIAYDLGAAGVTLALADLLGAPAILSRFSRLVIDPNRGPDDPTLIMKLYDGTIIPANRHIDAAEETRRQGPIQAGAMIHMVLEGMLGLEESGRVLGALVGAVRSRNSLDNRLRNMPNERLALLLLVAVGRLSERARAFTVREICREVGSVATGT